MRILVLCVLLYATGCSGQGVQAGVRAAGSKSVTVQPWLVGLTAVVCFLFIVFIILIVHRLLRKNREDEEGWGEVEGDDSKQTSL